MLGMSKMVISLMAMAGVLMQTGPGGVGCVQNLGLLPGVFGLATPGVGIATGLNPTPSNFNDILNPPDNGNFPNDPFGGLPGTPNLNLKGTILTLRNVDQFDMEVQYLIDGLLRVFVVRAGDVVTEVLSEENCIEAIDLLSVTVREQFTGLLVDNVDFLLDSILDWPGPQGPLQCGDTVRYSFDVIDIVQGIRLPDIVFFGDRVVMDVQTSRLGQNSSNTGN